LSTLSALVLDAHESHALAAIRTLGVQGVNVTAASPKAHAMGFASRHCGRVLQSPSAATHPSAYAEWVLETLRRDRFDALLFFGEASANVVAEHRVAIRTLTGCLVPDRETFLTADRKDQVTRLARAIGVPVPASHEIERDEDANALVDRLVFPVIIKAVSGSGGHQVRFLRTRERFADSVRAILALSPNGAPQRCLVQEYIPGIGYGFTALVIGGEPIAAFMHRRLAEHDVMRGAMLAHAATGAESVDEPELRASGQALLRSLRWDGMAMVEFRRSHRDGRFYLMEVNPRFPGSLALAIAAGVDFPSLYVQRAAGCPVTGPRQYRIGLRYRWLLSKGVAQAVEDPVGYGRSLAGVLRFDTRCDMSWRDPRPHLVQLREAGWWLREYERNQMPRVTAGDGWRHACGAFLRAGRWVVHDRGYAALGFAATVLAAMQGFTYPGGDHRLDLAWEGFCLLLGLAGLAIRIATVGYGALDVSERGRADAPDTTGMYSVLRYPLHVANLLMWLAIAAFPRKWWLPMLAVAAYWHYCEPMVVAETAAMRRRFGARYANWVAVTPRFWPRLSMWKRPQEQFASGRALRHGAAGLFALTTALTLLEVVGDAILENRVAIDTEWAGLFGTTAVAYATLSLLGLRRQPHS
jgi:predicted ATP-grasp superfamily ATP-dependent carboligase/protein-S-isoprenylcysteine O-methyltransferase Ste14